MTTTDDRSTWLRTGPLTAEQREAVSASVTERDLSAVEGARLLGYLGAVTDPIAAGREDCETAMREGADPADLARRDQLGADEALINAMGRGWVLRAAGAGDDQSERAWDEVGLPWCAQYSEAYRARAAEMTAAPSKFSTASKLAARWDVGFERSASDASWATTESLRGAEADALAADLAAAGLEASKAYDSDDRSRAWVYADLDEIAPEAIEHAEAPYQADITAAQEGK